MTTTLTELDWTDLLNQIRHHPDPKVRQEASRQAMERIWTGYDGDESRIPMSVFEPD